MATLGTLAFRGNNNRAILSAMKIAVIGARGKTGREFVNAALGAGHDIRAGTHGTETFKTSDHLSVMRIDALKGDDIDRLVAGCDAVVSVIGHVKDSPAYLQTTTISNVLSAMKRHGVTRLISVTGTGVRQPGDRVSFVDYILNTAVRITDPARIRDGIAHTDVIRDSDVDWTVLRVLKLVNGLQQPYSLTSGGPAMTIVSRRTVAEAILHVLDDKAYYHTMPVLSKK